MPSKRFESLIEAADGEVASLPSIAVLLMVAFCSEMYGLISLQEQQDSKLTMVNFHVYS